MSRIAAFLALLTLVCAAAPVAAHTRSETHSNWEIDGREVHMTFTVPDLEAKRLTQDGRTPSDARMAQYLAAHVGVWSGETACAARGAPRPVSAAPGYRRLAFHFVCSAPKELRVGSTAFFELVPTHVNFAQIQTADGAFVEQLITQDAQKLRVSDESGPALADAGFPRFVGMGVMHIFTGVDHQLFLLGLILLSRRLKDLTFIITGFTLGHSLTLALAVTGLLRPRAEYIDALVGLTIALVGVENIAAATRRPGPLAIAVGALLLLMAIGKMSGLGGLPVALLLGAALFSACYLMISGRLGDAGKLRLVVTLIFGLVHGFGFAADLLESKLPKARLAELLVGFNLGVEIGQLTLVLAVVGLVALLARLKLAAPRALVVDASAAFLAAMGFFWFVSRSYG